ncbi:hypothetical protein V5O48_019310 [Marasmius crinis-equi]|uniref:Uncharacterized protein n=1 Tax=Marasmius crinis-equi TaxID=585013 RepID=A0ABR3EIR2_9AGAR
MREHEDGTIEILDSDDEESMHGLSSSQDASFDWDPDYRRNEEMEDESSEPGAFSTRCSSPTAVDSSSEAGFDGELDELALADGDGVDEVSENGNAAFESAGFNRGNPGDVDSVDDEMDNNVDEVDEIESMDGQMEEEWKKSDTRWMDKGIWSEVLDQRTKVNRMLYVDRVERVHGGIPSNWPVPHVPTAYILDLDDAKYVRNGSDGNPVPLDDLILEEASLLIIVFKLVLIILLVAGGLARVSWYQGL